MDNSGDRTRLAVILTHNRQELLDRCLTAIKPQVDHVLVMDNASEPPAKVPGEVGYRYVSTQPPNLSQMWNIAFDHFDAMYSYTGKWDAAVLTDDAIVPEGWFDAVLGAMRATGAVVGCSNPHGHLHDPILKTALDRDIMSRMPGWAWIMNGEPGLRADERLHWWWCDTDMDFKARLEGGMVMIGGFMVPNVLPGVFTVTVPGLGEQAGRDGYMFEQIWGFRPW